VRQLEAAPDGETQTQACPEDGPEITGSRTIQIRSPEHPHVGSSKRSYDHAIREFIDWYCYEASYCGLLSPDLAAGIRRVKRVRRLGVRVGNWLTTWTKTLLKPAAYPAKNSGSFIERLPCRKIVQ
jgi:hypothetical protein